MLTVARKPAARPARLGRCPQRAESPPGFTLMELLVSFSLIGLVGPSSSIWATASGSAHGKRPRLPWRPGRLPRPPWTSSAARSLPWRPTFPARSTRAARCRSCSSGPPPKAWASSPPGRLPRASPGGSDLCSTSWPTPTPTPPPPGRRLLLNETAAGPRDRAAGPRHPGRHRNRGQPFPGRPGPAPGPAPAPSPWLMAWRRWPSTRWPGRERRVSRSAPGSIRAVFRRRRSRRNPRPQLPAAIRLSLRWNGQGPLGLENL